MKKDMLFLILILSALTTVFIIRAMTGTADTPAVFSDAHDLDQAMLLSQETGKPIVAVATADWCPPCQDLKRGALSDPEVVAFLRENTIPVYLEESTGMEQIRALGVRAYPTTVIFGSGEVFGTIKGGQAPGPYLSMIRDAVDLAG